MNLINAFQILILIVSVAAHEMAHGLAAYYFGDPTAKNLGRLTLNPLKHLDWFGSVILPALLLLSGSQTIIGWAKPVPYNPYNFRNRRAGEMAVAISGVAMNALIAIVFTIIYRLSIINNYTFAGLEIIKYIILINLVLFVFNLVPIPPLDGSKILLAFLPNRYNRFVLVLERLGLAALILFILFFSWVISYIVTWLFQFLIG